MKKILMAITLASVFMITFVTPVFASPNGPPANLGLNWQSVPPGERDDSVHSQQIEGNHPVGRFWVEWKRDKNLIPGWAKNGIPGPHK